MEQAHEANAAPIPALPANGDACRAILKAWDEGGVVHTIEMGGLGPGYEQALQILAIECMREGIDVPLEGDTDEKRYAAWDEICSRAVKRADDDLGGVSGAQFGAAKWLSWKWLHGCGAEELQEQCRKRGEDDRCIMVSRHWPKATGAAA